jgi:ribosomal protein L11 methyltransferase
MYQASCVVSFESLDVFCDAYLALGALSVSVFDVENSDVKRICVLADDSEWFKRVGGFAAVEVIAAAQWEFAHELSVTYVGLLPGIWIYSEGVEVRPEHQDDLVVRLDLRGAFGDGAHATTKLCAEFLKEICDKKAPLSVMDIGTGTGVLAILAAKFGVETVHAFDYDPMSVERTVCNVALNHVDVCVRQGDILTEIPEMRYDCVIANLHSGLIEEALPLLKRWVNKGGVIILSGVAVQWQESIETHLFAEGLKVNDFRILDGWCGFLVVSESY